MPILPVRPPDNGLFMPADQAVDRLSRESMETRVQKEKQTLFIRARVADIPAALLVGCGNLLVLRGGKESIPLWNCLSTWT